MSYVISDLLYYKLKDILETEGIPRLSEVEKSELRKAGKRHFRGVYGDNLGEYIYREDNDDETEEDAT